MKIGGVVPSWRSEGHDEPFDQQPKSRNMKMDEDILDDGELPSLTPRRLGTGQVSTSRKVTPNHMQIEQRKFWGQLDQHEDDDVSSNDEEPIERRSFDEDGGDMPDDELMANRRSGLARREIDNLSRQGDEHVDYPDSVDESYSRIGKTHTFNTAESEELQRATFCDETLTAIGNMCGGNLTAVNSSADDIQPEAETKSIPAPVTPPSADKVDAAAGMRRRVPLPVPQRTNNEQTETQEEHTAIEVEFVEPEGPSNTKRALTPERKNAYLTKMALKAKQDFWKKKDGKASSADKTIAQDDDVYKSFNGTEKRKFLALINSGTLPGEATKQILRERDEAINKKRSAEPDHPGGDDQPERRRNRGSLLGFWKKNKTIAKNDQQQDSTLSEQPPASRQKAAAPVVVISPESTVASKTAAPSPVEPPSTTAPTVQDQKKPRAPIAGVVAGGVAVTGAVVAGAAITRKDGNQADTKSDDKPYRKPLVPSAKTASVHVVAKSKSSDGDGQPEPVLKRYNRPSGVFSSSEKKTENSQSLPKSPGVDTTAPLSDESADDTNPGFAKSGISYYDAVRRDDDQDEGDAPGSVQAIPARLSKDKGKPERRLQMRSVGFAALTERRAKSTPRVRPEKDEPNASRELESAVAGTLTVAKRSPAGSSSDSTPSRKSELSPGSQSMELTPPTSNAQPRKLQSSVAMELLSEGSVAPALQMGEVQKGETSNPHAQSASTDSLAPPEKATVQSLLQSNEGPSHDNAALARIEEELLRPPSTKGLPPAEKPPISVKKKKRSVSLLTNGDGRIDSLLAGNKTAQVGHEQNSDTISVYTAGTGVTGITNGTNYTQSSRARRPGAAKSRLAKAKQAENTVHKGKGWHESIRAAAASNNRVWDAMLGWVDYNEPEVETEIPGPSSGEKIHLGLRKSMLSHRDIRPSEMTSARSTSVPVPFPREWEKERGEMIKTAANQDKSVQDVVEEKKLDQTIARNQDRGSGTRLTAPNVPEDAAPEEDLSRPRGWLETMKAASAALVKDGQKWDPETGWTGVDSAANSKAPDAVDFDEVTTAKSSTPRESIAKVDLSIPPADNAKSPSVVPGKESDKKLNQWIAKAEQGPKKQSEPSTESSDKAVVSANAGVERYVQLGDGGSIRSQALDGSTDSAKRSLGVHSVGPATKPISQGESAYISDDDTETDADADNSPLLNSAGAFPSLHDRAISPTANVAVIKEKVDQDDMDLFPQIEPRAKRTGGTPSVGSDGLKKLTVQDVRDLGRSSSTEKPRGFSVDQNIPSDVADSSDSKKRKRVGRGVETKSDAVENRLPVQANGAADASSAQENQSQMTGELTEFYRGVSRSFSSDGSGRGAGPIDMDEVDETWDSDDEHRRSIGWEAHSKVSVSASTRTREMAVDGRSTGGVSASSGWEVDSKSVASHKTSSSMPTKPVPKLRKNKRDTSPISRKSGGDSLATPADKVKQSTSLVSPLSTPGATAQESLDSSKNDTTANEKQKEGVTISGVTAQESLDSSKNDTTANEKQHEGERPNTSPSYEKHDLELFQQPTFVPHDRSLDVDLDRELELVMQQEATRNENRRKEVGGPNTAPDLKVSASRVAPKESTPSPSTPRGSTMTEQQGQESPSVKSRREEWESRARSGSDPDNSARKTPGTAEWKSFMGKKVQAETAAASRSSLRMDINHRKEPEGDKYSFQKRSGRGPVFKSPSGEGYSVEAQREDDSIFDFADNPRSSSAVFRQRSTGDASRESSISHPRGVPSGPMEDMADLSPIHSREEQSFDKETSEAYGPETTGVSSFFKRLSECAAPVMPQSKTKNPEEMTSGQSPVVGSRFLPPNLCGRPDIAAQDDESESGDEIADYSEAMHSHARSAEKPTRSTAVEGQTSRSKSAPKTRASADLKTSASSVISEDFGAKTAYLEALAMKSAVSKPRSSSRRKERSSGASSVVSTTSSAHSEKWKAFLERKRASGTPVKSRLSNVSSVSKAAEKYAADKVEEMMTSLAKPGSIDRQRHKAQYDDNVNSTVESKPSSSFSRQGKGSESMKAAEDLAAARVEAMMAALSSSQLEGEGEI